MKTKNKNDDEQKQFDEIEREKWLAIRKEAGREIDPETAELTWTYVCDFDPYGVNPELPEEFQQVGRGYFARSPGSDIWVSFDDIPTAICHALLENRRAKWALPALPPPQHVDPLTADDVSWGKRTMSVRITPGMKEAAMKFALQEKERTKGMFYPHPEG